MTPNRPDHEKGVTLIVVALAMVSLLIMVAIVMDIGFARGGTRLDQKAADLAALAGGKKLGAKDYAGACQDIVGYLNTNTDGMPAINATSFCSQAGNAMTATTCSGGGLTQAAPTTTSGKFTISVHFPVPDSEIADPKFGAGLNDGVPCKRMRVIVTAKEPAFFGKVVGNGGLSTTRSATMTAAQGKKGKVPALWLLDPTDCVALSVSGGSQVTVGTNAIPGVVSIDSDGSGCTGGQTTISSSGSGTNITALPTSGTGAGTINLFALGSGSTTCSGRACDQNDVNNGRLTPQPIPSDERATRAPVDYKWNCKTGYPTYHGIVIPNCADTTPKYIDRLQAAVGNSGLPAAGYQQWTATGHSCNVPSGPTVVTGNWWIDCPLPNGLQIGNNVDLTFQSGNIVLDGGITMSGTSKLNINTANATASLGSSCLPPTVMTPCLTSSSADAGFVYFRAGNFEVTGGSPNFNHSMVYLKSGYVKFNSVTPRWTAPKEGPFLGLALWAEFSSNKFAISGGAGVYLEGTFFTPEANALSLAGGGNWGQQNAQFISYHLAVSGGGTLTMTPDPDNSPTLPPKSGILIR